jgi:hypothetical protein
MRPITKKNVPYNNSFEQLYKKPDNNQYIKDLKYTFDLYTFFDAVINLVNLTDNTKVSSLIEKRRNDIKQTFTNLDHPYVQDFNDNFITTNFPNVDIDNEITPWLEIQSPNPDTIFKVLTKGTGVKNNLNILKPPFNVALQTIENIGTLLVLGRLIYAGNLRNLYEDARYNEINKIIVQKKPAKSFTGEDHGKSKPYLVKLTGLYCNYCESTLSDGASTHVEHKLPKSAFPTMEKDWSNFVLSCERCNTGFKGQKYVHPEGIISIDPVALPSTSINSNTHDAFEKEKKQFIAILDKVITNITDSRNSNYIIRGRENITNEEDRRAAAMMMATDEVNNVFQSEFKSDNKAINFFCGDAAFVPMVKADIARIAIYKVTVKYATDKVIWPDKLYTGEGIEVKQRLNSFMAFDYDLRLDSGDILPTPIELKNITSNTDLQINEHDKKTHINLINLKNTTGIQSVSAVQVKILIPDYSQKPFTTIVSDVNKVKSSGENIISITGLNNLPADDVFMDQRVLRRTKAWLHAMKMLKQLTEFNMQKFKKLHDYYEEQLHPVNIKYNATIPTPNNIAGLRDNTAAPVELDDITGNITISKRQINGEINLKFDKETYVTTGDGTDKIKIKIKDDSIPGVDIKLGSLTAKIVDLEGIRTMSGSLEVGTITENRLSKKIIFFKNATTDNVNSTTVITIGKEQGVISADNGLGTASSAAEILKEWDNNRSELLGVINQTTAILKDFMWENILDMVRTGGFYSTWIRTFKKHSPDKTLYDVDLVRKLEMIAMQTPNDPHQFHGTDVADILNCL